MKYKIRKVVGILGILFLAVMGIIHIIEFPIKSFWIMFYVTLGAVSAWGAGGLKK